MIFFQCAPLTHHAGHISFWGHRPMGLTKVPYAPRRPARSAVLRVVAWWPTEAEGRSVHSFAGRRWGMCDLSPGAGGRVGVEQVLESARSCVGTYGAAIQPALDLGWQLDAERRCSRGDGVQELSYSL